MFRVLGRPDSQQGGSMSGYEQRCEGCRFSECSDRYAGNWSMRCSKRNAATARDNQCDKFEREPGADDEKTGGRNER